MLIFVYLIVYNEIHLLSLVSSRELSRFIAAGRLNCKIDKVGGVVETNRYLCVVYLINFKFPNGKIIKLAAKIMQLFV